MNPETETAALMTVELAPVDSQTSPMPVEAKVARNVWTRDIDALCRAVEAQQRASGPPKT